MYMKPFLFICTVIVLVPLNGCITDQGQKKEMSTDVAVGSLKFKSEIPDAPAELPLLKLERQPAPIGLMNRVLASANNSAKLEQLGESALMRTNRIKLPGDVVGFVEDDHVKAWASLGSGEAEIYPTMGKLKPISPSEVSGLASRAREILESPGFIIKDDTRLVIDAAQVLNGTTVAREGNGNTRLEKPTAPYAAYVLGRRFVGDFRVDGVGSRALVVVGSGGRVEGLTRVWKSGRNASTVKAAWSASQVQEEITRQLAPAAKTSEVVVDSIRVAYYDGNRKYLQPVYRFTARIHQLTSGGERTADDFVIGYIPFGKKSSEPLPQLGKSGGPKPKMPGEKTSARKGRQKGDKNDPTVGRYVVREAEGGFVDEANDFWNSLSGAWAGSLFSNSQYYWAEQRLYTNEKDSFVNSMNIALTEAHGDWWLFSALKNCCELVNINGDIPSPGYGPTANGQLALWVIRGCEVVPSPDDTANWPDPWWTVFGGLRNVVGIRTIGYLSDGSTGVYGKSIGTLAPVVSSWLSDVISLNAYSGNPTYAAHGGVVRPMGRPCTISMCGHDNESALNTWDPGRAGCLTVWWFPD